MGSKFCSYSIVMPSIILFIDCIINIHTNIGHANILFSKKGKAHKLPIFTGSG